MRLEFERTLDDYVAFVRMYYKRSRKARKQRLRNAFVLVPFYFLLNWFMLHNDLVDSFVGALIGGLTCYVITPLVAALLVRIQHRHSVGTAQLEVLPDGLVASMGDHDLKTRWSGVGDIVTKGERTFIYISENQAHIIPLRRITDGNYVLFMQELARRLEAHTLAPLNAASAGSVSPTPALPTIATSETNPDTVPLQRG